MNILIVVLVFFLLCIGYGKILEKFGLHGLACTRAFSARSFFEGEEGELVEVISNDRPVLIPWLRVESRISHHLRFGRQENLDISGSIYHKSLFILMPYQRITRRHRVKFAHRGAFDIGNATLTVGDVSGMFQCTRTQRFNAPVLVYPRILEDEDLPMPLSRLIGEAIVQRQLLRDPFLVNNIRAYLPGDPVRDIHWPATARTGELHVRVHDFSAQTRLMVVINAQIKENQWADLMNYEQDAIEHEISVAATLCLKALRCGLTAGFCSNMRLDDREESVVMLPSGGEAREEELLTAFAHLNVSRTLHFNTFLETLYALSGLDFVVLSCYDSPAIQARLEGLRQRGNTVNFFLMDRDTEVAHEA
ncbi:MAG: DUF58 domain-containing protein [Clostridiales bacterium]|nr:DUF58 domain-containing protein [Clostridiales bacterium]